MIRARRQKTNFLLGRRKLQGDEEVAVAPEQYNERSAPEEFILLAPPSVLFLVCKTEMPTQLSFYDTYNVSHRQNYSKGTTGIS